MEKTSFVFHKEWKEAIKDLPSDIRLEIYDSIIEYATTGNVQGLKPMAMIAFNFIKPRIDRDIERYERQSDINRVNGSKGGRPKKITQQNQNNPVGFNETKQNRKKHDSDSVYDSVGEGEGEVKSPPPPNLGFVNPITPISILTNEENKTLALQDNDFMAGAYRNGLTDPARVSSSLDHFNRTRGSTGKSTDNYQNYRSHFFNWIRKGCHLKQEFKNEQSGLSAAQQQAKLSREKAAAERRR